MSERLEESDLQQVRTAHDHDPAHLHFGFELRGEPDEDARQYLPFLDYLEKTTGLQFDLHFTAANDDIAEQLGTGRLQIAAIGGYTYIRARAAHGVIPLVRGLSAEGRAEYRSVIVVEPGSPIRGITELRGKRVAFGDEFSTQGHLIPRFDLLNNGISLDRLAEYEFFGSHQNCVNTVIDQRFDACGMQDVLGQRLAGEGAVRIVHTSDFFPSSGIAANKNVPVETLETIRMALVEFVPSENLPGSAHLWERTEMAGGFREASDEDYALLRQLAASLELTAVAEPEKPPSD